MRSMCSFAYEPGSEVQSHVYSERHAESKHKVCWPVTMIKIIFKVILRHLSTVVYLGIQYHILVSRLHVTPLSRLSAQSIK